MLGIVTLGLFVRASAGVAAIASAKTIATYGLLHHVHRTNLGSLVVLYREQPQVFGVPAFQEFKLIELAPDLPIW